MLTLCQAVSPLKCVLCYIFDWQMSVVEIVHCSDYNENNCWKLF